MQIIPLSALKDTSKIERLCSEENGPVFVTKNGYGCLVVMKLDYYQQTMQGVCGTGNVGSGMVGVG